MPVDRGAQFQCPVKHGRMSPAVSDLLAAGSPQLLRPAERTNRPPVSTLSGVDLEQEAGAVQPH